MWTVDSKQWTVDSGQWTVDSRQWAVGTGQWALGSGQWAASNNGTLFCMKSVFLKTKSSLKVTLFRTETIFKIKIPH